MSYILVSVIVPAYNEENQIKDLIKSLINQDFPSKFEIIIVDNKSNDNIIDKIYFLKKKDKIKNLKIVLLELKTLRFKLLCIVIFLIFPEPSVNYDNREKKSQKI